MERTKQSIGIILAFATTVLAPACNSYKKFDDQIQDIRYEYKGSDGFTLSKRIGDIRYEFEFSGECRNEDLHWLAEGNSLGIYNYENSLSLRLYDNNCDNSIDSISSENGSCTADIGRFSRDEACSKRTYDEAMQMYNDALKVLHVNEFERKYYRQRYNSPEMPQDQTERLLKGFRAKNQ